MDDGDCEEEDEEEEEDWLPVPALLWEWTAELSLLVLPSDCPPLCLL